MENFNQLYAEALALRAVELEKGVCPRLKATFTSLYSYYKTYYSLLLNRYIIRADQYGDFQKVTAIQPPSSEPFLEATAVGQLSTRLLELERQFDYLHSYFDVNLQTISLKNLKDITSVLNYIDWDNISVGNPRFITKILAQLTQGLQNETLAAELLYDITKNLATQTKTASSLVKDLAFYLYEQYKQYLIEHCFPLVPFNPKKDRATASKLFTTQLRVITTKAKLPFYRVLVSEAFEMMYGEESVSLQQKTIDTLRFSIHTPEEIVPQPVNEEKETKNNKEPLFNAFFELSRCEPTLDAILTKLSYSHKMYLKYGQSFGEKFLYLLQQFITGQGGYIYKTAYVNPVTGQLLKEDINFEDLSFKILETMKTFKRFADINSSIYKQMDEFTGEEIRNLLVDQVRETRSLLTLCAALNDFFKRQGSSAMKERPKSINIEITSVKRQLSKVQELRHAYETLIAQGMHIG